MAKSKYPTHVEPYLEQITEMKSKGVIEKDIAESLGITEETFNQYKKKFPDFSEALKSGKKSFVEIAESKLFELVEKGDWNAIQYTLNNYGGRMTKYQERQLDIRERELEKNQDVNVNLGGVTIVNNNKEEEERLEID